MTEFEALQIVLNTFGRVDYKGINRCSIPLHKADYLSLLPAEVVQIITTLPYASNELESIAYNRKQCDEVINLHVWSI